MYTVNDITDDASFLFSRVFTQFSGMTKLTELHNLPNFFSLIDVLCLAHTVSFHEYNRHVFYFSYHTIKDLRLVTENLCCLSFIRRQ